MTARRIALGLAAVLLAAPVAASDPQSTPAAAAGCDAARGRQVFAKCLACHSLDPGGAHSAAGPNLHGVHGRRAGAAPGFGYSPALQESGITWNEAELTEFLTRPAKMIPGTTMMFVGLKSAADRAALVCFLRETGRPAEASPPASAPAAEPRQAAPAQGAPAP